MSWRDRLDKRERKRKKTFMETLLLTAREAAAQLKMDLKAFRALEIPWVELGKRKRRYRMVDLEEFVRKQLRYPYTPPPPEPRRRNEMPYADRVSLPTWDEAKKIADRQAKQQAGQRQRFKERITTWQEIEALSRGNQPTEPSPAPKAQPGKPPKPEGT